MVVHISKPIEALKIMLYHLFSEVDVRTLSLKGINTGYGGAGLDKQRLGLLYSKYGFLLV